MRLQTSIITDPTYFDAHAAEWIALSQTALTAPFFMHPAYQKAWWQHEEHGDLQIIEVRAEGQLVGLLPLHSLTFAGKTVLRMVGAVDVSDYLDLLVDTEHVSAVYQEFITQLEQMQWDELWLECLHHESPTLQDFADLLRQQWAVNQKLQDVCPVLKLPDSFETYLENLDSRQRKHFRKLRRNIGSEDEIEYTCVTEANEISELMPQFIELHKASSTEKKNFWSSEREAFFTEGITGLAEEGLVRLYFLHVNQDPAASLLLFEYHNEWLGYNSGFNAYRYGYLGVSNAIFLHAIEEAIKQGVNCFDFMRGSEEYKFQFGAKAQPLYDLIVTRE